MAEPKNKIDFGTMTASLSVDTSSIDEAMEKVKAFNELLDETEQRLQRVLSLGETIRRKEKDLLDC